MFAEGRVRMFEGTRDMSYLTNPHMKLTQDSFGNREWDEDHSVPKLAYKLAIERGLLK